MTRCLVPSDALETEACQLPPETARHLRTVLRARPGDAVQLLDGAGGRRTARLEAFDRGGVRCTAAGPVERLPPPRTALRLYACIAKGARMDWLVEKAVELGASALVPVLAQRCVARFAAGETVARWERLADSALEQCGGVWRLRIEPVHAWTRALADIRVHPPVFAALLAPGVPSAAAALAAWPERAPASAAWIVGPEGDFTAVEQQELLAAGAIPVGLGPRVLRTETAALYGLCALALAFRSAS